MREMEAARQAIYTAEAYTHTGRMTPKKAIDIAQNTDKHSRETLNLARLKLGTYALGAFPSSARQKELSQHQANVERDMERRWPGSSSHNKASGFTDGV
jgi:hypothetical protein